MVVIVNGWRTCTASVFLPFFSRRYVLFSTKSSVLSSFFKVDGCDCFWMGFFWCGELICKETVCVMICLVSIVVWWSAWSAYWTDLLTWSYHFQWPWPAVRLTTVKTLEKVCVCGFFSNMFWFEFRLGLMLTYSYEIRVKILIRFVLRYWQDLCSLMLLLTAACDQGK